MNESERRELRRAPAGVERHYLENGLEPGSRHRYRGVDFVTAQGGPFYVQAPKTDTEWSIWREHPNGYYEVAWAVLKNDVPFIGGINLIDIGHDRDKGWSESERERARWNAAVRLAEQAIDDGIKNALEAA